ncbi:glutaredoxin family protein [Massilia glaciei]|uniref:Glutaredoxin family protein n=1 Tax=Massilia glaciei TaxID=1524097 RepID=A0A2U2HIY0_9BURK|nr:glutaredoxin family protein [Massilia glaciei]PWF46785.1 glutaredoxin family protein [Massilia glaciei]
MKKAQLLLPLGAALLLCAGGASAQLFKWVDAKGTVHFSDTPPPDKAKALKVKSFSGVEGATPLPYELAQAARGHPVTLFTTAPCAPCDAGRTHLNARGIPFSEKTVTTVEDQAKMTAAGGTGTMPLLLVGPSKLAGFDPGAWDAALTNADYPLKSQLPRTYRNPAAAAAAPPPPKPTPSELAAAKAAIDAAAEARRPKPAAPAVPPKPGFQF